MKLKKISDNYYDFYEGSLYSGMVSGKKHEDKDRIWFTEAVVIFWKDGFEVEEITGGKTEAKPYTD
jgi:hypothetical protein